MEMSYTSHRAALTWLNACIRHLDLAQVCYFMTAGQVNKSVLENTDTNNCSPGHRD